MNVTDDEILKAQTELQAELTNDSTEADSELIPAPNKEIEIAIECIDSLIHAQETISTEGVCTSDLVAIKGITDRLSQIGVNLPASVSLERYIPFTTADRSPLNLNVSSESIGRTIIEGIRKIIRWIIDAFTSAVNWFRSLTKNDTLVTARIKAYDSAAFKLNGIYNKVRSYSRDRDAATTIIKEMAKEVLRDKALDKNSATLVAFNKLPNLNNSFDKRYQYLTKGSPVLIENVNKLVKFLESINDKASLDQSLRIQLATGGVGLAEVKEFVNEFYTVSEDEDYFYNQIQKGNFDHWFINPDKTLGTRKFYSYQKVFDDFVTASKSLANLKRIDKAEHLGFNESQKINEIIKEVHEEIKALQDFVQQLVKLRSYYIKVSALHVNAFLRAIDIIKTEILNTKVTDTIMGNVEKTEKELEAIRKSVGL